jgi:hypothetical protein
MVFIALSIPLALLAAAPCPTSAARKPGPDTRLVFLGDSGYGTGSSAWGHQDQAAVARQMQKLAYPADRVYFLGDNVYWKGTESLFAERFDQPYAATICRSGVRVVLGNHDVKGCRTAAARGLQDEAAATREWDERLEDLQLNPRERGGVKTWLARARAQDPRLSGLDKLVGEVNPWAVSSLLSPWELAYEAGGAPEGCHARSALEHRAFAFPCAAPDRDGHCPENHRWRYHSDVVGNTETLLLDSNTLAVADSPLDPTRWDTLQLLWLGAKLWDEGTSDENGTHAPGDVPWKLVAFHHPPFTPDGCVFKVATLCVEGHKDEVGLQGQLKWIWALADADEGRPAIGAADPPAVPEPVRIVPDAFLTAHNHFYSRTRPLGREGVPVSGYSAASDASRPGRDRGVRYFLSGGGGAPLYEIKKPWSERIASAQKIHHFVYFRLTDAAAFYWAIDSKGKVRDAGCFHRGSDQDHPGDGEILDIPPNAAPEKLVCPRDEVRQP